MLLGHEPASAAFETGGLTLSAAPALLPPVDDPPAARVFKELDVTAHVKRKTATSEVSFRLLLPGQRLDVTRDRALQERELGRAFGAAGGSVGGVIERLGDAARLLDPIFASAITLPPNGFWERREVGRLRSLLPKPTTDLFAPLPAEHPFRAMASLPAVHGTAFVAHDIGPIGEARAFEIARRGQPRLRGRPGGPAGAAAGAAGDVRRRPPRAADARRDRRPARPRRRRARAPARRDHRLPSPAVGGLGGRRWPPRWRPRRSPAAQAPAARARDRLPLQHGRARRAGRAAGGHAVAAAGDRRSVARADRGQRRRDHGRPADCRATRGASRCGSSAACPRNLVEAGASYLRSLRGRVTHVVRRLLPEFAAAHGRARVALRRPARRRSRHPRPRDHPARRRCRRAAAPGAGQPADAAVAGRHRRCRTRPR